MKYIFFLKPLFISRTSVFIKQEISIQPYLYRCFHQISLFSPPFLLKVLLSLFGGLQTITSAEHPDIILYEFIFSQNALEDERISNSFMEDGARLHYTVVVSNFFSNISCDRMTTKYRCFSLRVRTAQKIQNKIFSGADMNLVFILSHVLIAIGIYFNNNVLQFFSICSAIYCQNLK